MDTNSARRPTISDTYEFAKDRHSRHKDKSGNPYFDHVNGVFANTVAILGIVGHALTDEEKNETMELALLHDLTSSPP